MRSFISDLNIRIPRCTGPRCLNSLGGVFCSRRFGHRGRHAATGFGGLVVRVWS